MDKKKKSYLWILPLSLIIIIALVYGFYLKKDMPETSDSQPTARKKIEEAPPAQEPKPAPQTQLVDKTDNAKTEPPQKQPDIIEKNIQQPPVEIVPVDPCKDPEERIVDLLEYLNQKKYIQSIEENIDCKKYFDSILTKLSSEKPIPGGENLSAEVMTKNIFFFFRTFKKNEILLIKKIIANEPDILERNMELFYEWFILEECDLKAGIYKPSLENLYCYAGFFINTIGGRSSLFRRSAELRLVLSYYSIMIIYHADQNGMNNYGINVLSNTKTIIHEIEGNSNLEYKNKYLRQLNKILSKTTDVE